MIFEADTEHQYARVVQYRDGERRLELNEGQAVHSIYRPDTVLTGDYWDGLPRRPVRGRCDAAAARRDPRQRRRGRRRAPTGILPRHAVDAVEIDGELLEIGRRYFDMRRGRGAHAHARTRGRSCAAPTSATT